MHLRHTNKSTLTTFLTLIICTTILLSGCSPVDYLSEYQAESSQEGLFPKHFSNENSEILFGYSFQAPKEALTLEINIVQYDKGDWHTLQKGEISIGEEREPISQLAGDISIYAQSDGSISLNINCSGMITYEIAPHYISTTDKLITAATIREHTKIELEKELPIAILAYDDDIISTIHIDDFYDHNPLKKFDLVQAIVIRLTSSVSSSPSS